MQTPYTFNQALDVLRKHLTPESKGQAPSFNDCMAAMRVLSDLRGNAAEKAESAIIAVARDSKNVWLRHAALNRLQDMVMAEELEVNPAARKLATFDLVAAMAAVYCDKQEENYLDEAGGIPKTVRNLMLQSQNLARTIISAALHSNPDNALKEYWASALEKHNKRLETQEAERKRAAHEDKIRRNLKLHILNRRIRAKEAALALTEQQLVAVVATPEEIEVNMLPASALSPAPAAAQPAPESPTPPVQPKTRIPTLDRLHFTLKPKL